VTRLSVAFETCIKKSRRHTHDDVQNRNDHSTPHTSVVPPHQPLPAPVLHPVRPALKPGMDVHLEFIMAVVQRGHTSPWTPRKFTPDQLID
jgi:hypothetical protein